MLQVVDDQQDVTVVQVDQQGREGILPGLLANTDHAGDGRHDQRGIDQRCEIDEPYPVREVVQQLCRNLE